MSITKRLINSSKKRAVPYHNDCKDTYFFGNSIVGASGAPNGELSFVIGPDYTSPNYISSEKLYLVIYDEWIELDLQMKRLRSSGVFFGTDEKRGVRICVWDFAPPEIPYVIRYINAEYNNTSSLSYKNIKIGAKIVPFECETELLTDGICIHKDTTHYCFGNRETLNWADRHCKIGFAENSLTKESNSEYILTAPVDENGNAALVHHCYYDGNETLCLNDFSDFSALLENTLNHWEVWLAKGHMPYIENQRDADALESLLLCVKMQQNRDGGAIAGIRKYANSYIRDTHGCMRLLLATGHHEEVALLLRNIHTRWECGRFIPNWWSMGSDSFIGHSFNNDVSEITAYYIFMARDYVAHTDDHQLLDDIMPSLGWAANAQLDWLRSHEYTMDFNGDETEQYCCNKDGEEYGFFVDPEYPWDHKALSFSSMCAALCSLEWYSESTGVDWSDDLSKLRNKIDEVFYNEKDGLHVWHAKPSDNGWIHHKGHLTNFLLMPLWIGASLNNKAEKTSAVAVKNFVRDDGFLPNCPQVMPGFCGHTMGIFLYDMLILSETDVANKAVRTILDSNLLSMYGTVSEFYGPSCVPNGHNCRGFEGGIVGEALVKFYRADGPFC